MHEACKSKVFMLQKLKEISLNSIKMPVEMVKLCFKRRECISSSPLVVMVSKP